MEMTLRWYGEGYDSVTLNQIRQIPGVTGVISTLYGTQPGEEWKDEEIKKLKSQVETAGLHLSGIESVNIADEIKTGDSTRDLYIERYIRTLEKLGQNDIHMVCYNFMPVFDWTRSDLAKPRPDGSNVLAYDQKQIDQIDQKMLALFKERMGCSAEVAEYKRGTGKAIYDPVRERQKIDALTKDEDELIIKKSVEEMFLQMMSISRRYQYSLLSQEDAYIDQTFEEVEALDINEDTKVVYQGIPGAYQEQAMVQYFGEDVKNFSVPEFKDVVKTLDRGEADYGVLPIENTSAGTVSGIYDMILDYDICVVGEESVDVKHVLAAIPGTSLDKIEKVYSHPQGLMQCKGFLDEHPDWDQVKVANTAISAKKVADDNKPVKAAICSERAAKMYGLEILKREVNDEGNNTTRFVIMSKKKQYRKDAGKVSISFSVPHESGSLYNILTHFMFNNVSMSNIESRPLPGRKWEYGFYVDVIGNLDDPAIRNSLAGIKEETKDFKILGNF